MAVEIGPLAELLMNLQRTAIPVPQLASSVARLMALARQLRLAGLRRTDMDLVTANYDAAVGMLFFDGNRNL